MKPHRLNKIVKRLFSEMTRIDYYQHCFLRLVIANLNETNITDSFSVKYLI